MLPAETKNHPLFLGIDVGFGDVKVAAEKMNGGKTVSRKLIKYPTVFSKVRNGDQVGLDGAREHLYSYDETFYKLGTDALGSRSVRSIRNINTLIELSPLFVFKALEEVSNAYGMKIEQIIRMTKYLSVGLPLENFLTHKNRLSQTLQQFLVSGEGVIFNNKIDVRAQGQGVQFDFQYNTPEAAEIGPKPTLVVLDIGYNTVDIFCVDQGRGVKEYSFMLNEWGICRLFGMLRNEQELRINRIKDEPDAVLKTILETGIYKHVGQIVDISHVVNQLSELYIDQLMDEVLNRVRPFLNRADKLVVAGGGSYFVKNYIEKEFSNAPNFVHFMGSCEFSNALGYLAFLKRSIAQCQQ